MSMTLTHKTSIIIIRATMVCILCLIFIPVTIGDVEWKYIQVILKTDGDLFASLFSINYRKGRDVETDYHIEFTTSGDNPFIGIDVQWSGNKTNVVFGSARVTVFSSLFRMQNGTSRRISFWEDPYYSQFHPQISEKSSKNYLSSYSFNLTHSIEEAKIKFANKVGLATAEQTNLGARIFFSTSDVDTIREQGQERHLEFIFQSNKANLLLFIISVAIPDDSDFLGELTLNGVKMDKVLKQVEGVFHVDPLGYDVCRAVVEWRVPKAPAFWKIPPTSWILSAVIGGLTVSIPLSLLSAYLWHRIDKKLTLKKTERSVNYVKRGITSVYLDLIWRMQPPKDWRERLKKKNSNWDDYYGKVWSLKEDALHSLETLLDRYHHLLDAELTNDALEMVGLLNHPTTWMMADPNVSIERKGADLYSVASSVTNLVFQSINTIKRHKLVEDSEHRVITSRRGEPPKMRREKLTYASASTLKKRHYVFFEQLLKECIRFRDECCNSVFPKPKENKK